MISKKKLEIIRILNGNPTYGYDLLQKLNKGGTTIYTHLKELRELRYIDIKEIRNKSERNKTIYELTEKGKKLLDLIDS